MLVFHLHSGLEVLLGTGGDVRLKVAVAERALACCRLALHTSTSASPAGRLRNGFATPWYTAKL
jgi:hypothetical protein